MTLPSQLSARKTLRLAIILITRNMPRNRREYAMVLLEIVIFDMELNTVLSVVNTVG